MPQISEKKKQRKGRQKIGKSRNVYPVLIEKDGAGYFATCPVLQGCYTEGDSYEEALANITDVIRLHLEDRLAHGDPIPTKEAVSLTTVEVRI